MERIDLFAKNPFLDGPVEFLVKVFCEELAKVPQWKKVFADQIDPYLRMDYSIRQLPAIRVYNKAFRKTSENAWVTGDLLVDVIFPASPRRQELQQLQDTISGAMMQQLRRKPFFSAVRLGVPGLNELGREIGCDKSLGFMVGEDIVPLTEFTVNFKTDLRIWDDYLESQDRTVEDPFEKTLADLKDIANTIRAVTAEDASDPQGVSVTSDAGV